MENFKCVNLLLVMVVLLSLVACGGSNQMVYVPAPEPLDISRFQREAEQSLNDFREHIQQGHFEPAAMIAKELLDRYESRNRQLEMAVYTDLCLCALESAGDMDGFARYSGKLNDVTLGLEMLPRDTQFVLELSENLRASRRVTRRDLRIAADLSEGVGNIFD